ncbi:uncharacterized protein LOC107368281 [Tetranychus urticae]|uniref:uncharacterized protein LOC107368281 n=1 Tax=Tetranychus urticae TaxID=32264 RepID=UPI000D64790A|nr:uncharacterized protein LOC107368281 [Tetranychus urticae]
MTITSINHHLCHKWSPLIAQRIKKVKYFLDYYAYTFAHSPAHSPDYSHDYVFYRDRDPIDLAGPRTLFPNLIVAEFSDSFSVKVKFEDIVAFVRNHESLKGIITSSSGIMEEYCDKLEMLASDSIKSWILMNYSSLKQLALFGGTLHNLERAAHYLPNLERLHTLFYDSYHNGPVWEKLKVVELATTPDSSCEIFYGFQFMDSCPNLQSAHISVISGALFVDETLKQASLQDLVIDFYYNGQIWNDLKRTLMKYPNLKHLSLRSPKYMTDEHIKQLVNMLPNLVIFDVSRCGGVTQRAADYVKDYCKRNGRSTKFYFNGNRHEIQLDWPWLSTKIEKISRGFDFMKHCFLKDFYNLSYFLVPIDY